LQRLIAVQARTHLLILSSKPVTHSGGTMDKETQSTSAEDFLTKSPLYISVRVNGFDPPAQISFDCWGECAKQTTWDRWHLPDELGKSTRQVADWSLKSVAYKCYLCKKTVLTVVYREEQEVLPVGPGNSNPNLGPMTVSSMVAVTVMVEKVWVDWGRLGTDEKFPDR
jgi:hypothetical protein